MSTRKWGESFLKSGMPLEHVTLTTFRSMGYFCSPGIEYECPDGDDFKWRELDLFASNPQPNGDTSLSFLVECKYHDLSRFWFFLPHERERWYFNDRIFNCGPAQTLARPRAKGGLKLAPLSYKGMVVSEDGTKQENAVHNAVRQLASGFVPFSLSQFMYNLDVIPGYSPMATAIVPMIVTNARMFRLRPGLTSLNEMRQATDPVDIADEVGWTWAYFDPSMDFFDQNLQTIEDYVKREHELLSEFPFAHGTLRSFASRPNWIAVVNLEHLDEAVTSIEAYFLGLATRGTETLLGIKSKRTRN